MAMKAIDVSVELTPALLAGNAEESDHSIRHADERLALLRVDIERAEYWIAPGRLSYLVAAAKAAVTGTPVGVVGENRKIEE